MEFHRDIYDGSDVNDELEFWRDFIAWWEVKYGEPAAPRLVEALNIAEARALKALAEQVDAKRNIF